MKSILRNIALFVCVCALGMCVEGEAKSKRKDKEQCEKDCLSKCEKREKKYQEKIEKKERKNQEKAAKKERKKEKSSDVSEVAPSDKPVIIETPNVEISTPVVEVAPTDQNTPIGERAKK